MNGSSSKISVGTQENDNTIGKTNDKFKFLKNSISSNKFNTMPKERKTKIVIKKTLKNLLIKYLFITLFILKFSLLKFFLININKAQRLELQAL